MSHFTVAVISKSVDDIESLMAPYQENNMDDCPKEFMDFYDVEPKRRQEYENECAEKIVTPDGQYLDPWDDEFRKPGQIVYGTNTHEVPEDYKRVQVAFKDLYNTFDQFMKDWHGYDGPDPETLKYGDWKNPNARWDYWLIGGRFRGFLKASEGTLGELSWENTYGEPHIGMVGRYDSTKIKYLDLTPDETKRRKAIRFWEVNIEGQPLRESEEKDSFRCLWKPEYYLDRYETKEAYAEIEASIIPWALVTPDGVA